MSSVIVIGGGAAGMMAAISAAEAGAEVMLLEKNEKLGKKLFITGKGRCNVTNAAAVEELRANICTNPKFLYKAFTTFDNRDLMERIERAGCPLKVERGERVFPVSDHSSDVIAALKRELERLGVSVHLHTEVQKICFEEQDGTKHFTGVLVHSTDGKSKKLTADSCILCTGGLSYETTGSTGDGYRFAKEGGHSVTALRPSLVPLTVKEDWCSSLQGLSLRNVSVRMELDGKEIYDAFGEMLFTHFGVSGPLILSGSSFYAAKAKPGMECRLYIDCKPALTMEQLDKRLLREFDENKNKQFSNALGSLFPAKLIPVMVHISGIPAEKKIHDITVEERHAFAELIKALPLTVTGTRSFAEAIITKGGVNVKEVNPSTMESKLVRGLYFAGEVLDLDALTGGFNLQIAWSTGYVAGQSAALY